jgi:exodeoxyribonuclease-5
MKMKTSEFESKLLDKFNFEPTDSQKVLFHELTNFILNEDADGIFVLKGFAGTGKTSALSAFVSCLWQAKLKSVLLAPTGRAAKVISKYTSQNAFTIHKKIYFSNREKDGSAKFKLQINKHTDTIFFVDEASMISSVESKKSESLLNDLIDYVYGGKQCKLVFIGDTAQLPPVKSSISPALDASYLKKNYHKNVVQVMLEDVVRQKASSGILGNATELRMILTDTFEQKFRFSIAPKELIRLEESSEIQDAIQDAYNEYGVEETAIILRSNKRAYQYNQQIRKIIRGEENELAVGDLVMVVKNNYYWLPETSEAGFVANGDVCEVLEIHAFKDLYECRFAEVKLRMIDYEKQQPFEAVLLLDIINSVEPSVSYEDSNKLYQEISKDFSSKSKYQQMLEVKKNMYFNALQVKFSYAITCHKSQGGQWKCVFIEKPYLPKGQNSDYLRWLYTALTRAEEKIYLIGFEEDDFQ